MDQKTDLDLYQIAKPEFASSFNLDPNQPLQIDSIINEAFQDHLLEKALTPIGYSCAGKGYSDGRVRSHLIADLYPDGGKDFRAARDEGRLPSSEDVSNALERALNTAITRAMGASEDVEVGPQPARPVGQKTESDLYRAAKREFAKLYGLDPNQPLQIDSIINEAFQDHLLEKALTPIGYSCAGKGYSDGRVRSHLIADLYPDGGKDFRAARDEGRLPSSEDVSNALERALNTAIKKAMDAGKAVAVGPQPG